MLLQKLGGYGEWKKSSLQTNFSLQKKKLLNFIPHTLSVGLVKKKSLLSAVAFSLNSEKRGIGFS